MPPPPPRGEGPWPQSRIEAIRQMDGGRVSTLVARCEIADFRLRREFPYDSEAVRAASGYAIDIATAVDDQNTLRAFSIVCTIEILKIAEGPASTVRTALKDHFEGVSAVP
jgi:hypothetical protein